MKKKKKCSCESCEDSELFTNTISDVIHNKKGERIGFRNERPMRLDKKAK